MKHPYVLPEAFLKCLSPADRKSLGKGGMTAEEALAKAEARNERELQGQIVNLLRLKGIEPLWHRTDKRSAATVGWPDITFCVSRYDNLMTGGKVYPCAWEVKYGDGRLSREQLQMAIRLQSPPNCWIWREIRSVDQALNELREMRVA